MLRTRRRVGPGILVVSTTAALLTCGAANASVAAPVSGRVQLASTAPASGTGARLSPLAAAQPVRMSVFVGRDAAGLAATAAAVSDPASASYQHFLTPAQVQARYGATAAQQRAVMAWLRGAGLRVTYTSPFTISALGSAARAQAAVAARLELSRPRDAIEQVVPARAMSVPAAVAGAVRTVQLAPAVAPVGQHEPLRAMAAGTSARVLGKERCSAYYGQIRARGLPGAYGHPLTWAPCGYLPQQLRAAYGAARSGLTRRGVTLAIMSEDNDYTARADANRWAAEHGFPAFRPGQYTAVIAPHAFDGVGDIESALDVESSHGMAPDAKIDYVVGNGTITGDRLLDSLDTIVTRHLANVVSSSWFEGYMPVPASMISAWEGVLQRAAAEGITVNFATGDYGDETPLQYPGSDPWITTVGGTSLAVGRDGKNLWETGWESDQTDPNRSRGPWSPAPPGSFAEGSTGGVSHTFAEPSYQRGVVHGNTYRGHLMRDVPDVSDLGDWNLGYKIGVTVQTGRHTFAFENQVNGGTSLASPMFTGFEADLIQGRGGKPLGFFNPALYARAGTATFHDVTGSPQGPGVTEAVVFGPSYRQAPTLSTMGQCASTKHLACGRGYDTVSGIGSPGPAFFRSFGSRPVR